MTLLSAITSRLSQTAASTKPEAKALSASLAALFKSKGANVTRSFTDKDQDADRLYYCFAISVLPGVEGLAMSKAACAILNGGNPVADDDGMTWKCSKLIKKFRVGLFNNTDDRAEFVVSVQARVDGTYDKN